jgi:hypothetical protein
MRVARITRTATGSTHAIRRRFAPPLLALALALPALATQACGSSGSGSDAAPCDSVFAGKCGGKCAMDGDCAAGLYCGASGTCTADCASGAASCQTGLACSSSGRCVSSGGIGFTPGSLGGDGGAGATCAAETHRGEGIPLDMFVMWDRSGSMGEQVNGGVKWVAVTTAFNEFLADPLSAGISVGIQFFPLPAKPGEASDKNASCNIPDYATPAVPIAPLPGNAAALTQAFAAAGPAGYTPTRVSLSGAIEYARGWAQQHPAHKTIVVLQTDGQPNVCGSTVPSVVQVAAAGLSGTPSIQTYVIGVGTDRGGNVQAALAALSQIAQAGGTGQALMVDTTQNVEQQFIDAMNKIRGAALQSCEFQIPAAGASGPLDFGKVNVTFTPNGGTQSELLQAPGAAQCPAAGGWYYDDAAHPTRVLLCPSTCQAVKADPKAQVDLLLGCATKSVPIQ